MSLVEKLVTMYLSLFPRTLELVKRMCKDEVEHYEIRL